MTEIIVSPAADRDTDEILEAIRINSGPTAAAAFDESLDALYLRLSRFPDSGAPRPLLGRDIRMGILRPYLILYRYVTSYDRIEILRVLHGRRDIIAEMAQS